MAEKKTPKAGAVKVTVLVARTLRSQFAKKCKAKHISMCQRLRDLMQREVKK